MTRPAWALVWLGVWCGWATLVLRRPAKDWDQYHSQNLALLVVTVVVGLGWIASWIWG